MNCYWVGEVKEDPLSWTSILGSSDSSEESEILPMEKASLLREEDKENLKEEVGQANTVTGTGMMRYGTF